MVPYGTAKLIIYNLHYFFYFYQPKKETVSTTVKDKLIAYLPGIILFIIGLYICLHTYPDYGISWDEHWQREFGNISYNYVFNGDKTLLTYAYGYYGVGLELPLMCIEKWGHLTDTRDVYLMRHEVTSVLFMISALAGYSLALRLFKNNVLASIGFLMFVLCPRIYAHSFFNSKDVGFLSVFLITLSFAQYAFAKNKPGFILILGLLSGYTTSIRIMAVILGVFITGFLLLDFVAARRKKENTKQPLINIGLFALGFCLAVYIAWPYLWVNPIYNFFHAYELMSHYDWNASVLLAGNYEKTMELPASYFPTWFSITVPVLWLLSGVAGIVLIVKDLIAKPLDFSQNTNDRNFLLYLLCFFTPVLAVIMLHSIIYDDWRHLYFVYPSFVLMGLYALNKIYMTLKGNLKYLVPAACAVQALLLISFMVKAHPFQQVYFNELVSHEDEYLRQNYEFEYWGASFKQALEHIAAVDKADTINICCNYTDPVTNNLMILPASDRKRFKILPVSEIGKADFFVTNYRGHPEDYPSKNIEYSRKVLNSTVICVFKIKGAPAQASK